MAPWVPAFLKGIWDLGSQYFEQKKEEKQAIHKAKLVALEQDHALIKQGESSLKDEWWTFILSLPLFQLMIAPVIELVITDEEYKAGDWAEAVHSGLQGLSGAPDWYVYLVGVSALYSFGIKPTAKSVKELMVNKVNK